MCFNSNCPTVWVEKSKIGFQDGGYGGHFGFPIGKILAIFHLHVNLLLHCKFQLFNMAAVATILDFRLKRLKLISICSCPVATEQVSAKIHQRFGNRCQKLIFKMAAVAAILDFRLAHQF